MFRRKLLTDSDEQDAVKLSVSWNKRNIYTIWYHDHDMIKKKSDLETRSAIRKTFTVGSGLQKDEGISWRMQTGQFSFCCLISSISLSHVFLEFHPLIFFSLCVEIGSFEKEVAC